MKKLSKEIQKTIIEWQKDLNIYKNKFVGLKPTDSIMKKILKDTGVDEVVFWNYDGFSTMQGHYLKDVDASLKMTAMKRTLLLVTIGSLQINQMV